MSPKQQRIGVILINTFLTTRLGTIIVLTVIMLVHTACLVTGNGSGQAPGMITIETLAQRLGMQIDEQSPAKISIRNTTDQVVILPQTAQVFLNGTLIAESVNVTRSHNTYFVHTSLETGIHGMLHPVQINGRVVIDAGHGGKDQGATSVYGVNEKDIVLPVAKEIAHQLRLHGIDVIMTRDNDYFIELNQRAKIANNAQADLFVSVHADSASNPQAQGFTAYIGSRSDQNIVTHSKALAEGIDSAMQQGSSLKSRGIRDAKFRVLMRTQCPAVLVELGYLSNRSEATFLQSDAFQQRLAYCIATGIKGYLTIPSVAASIESRNP